jgi:hypothetical protein
MHGTPFTWTQRRPRGRCARTRALEDWLARHWTSRSRPYGRRTNCGWGRRCRSWRSLVHGTRSRLRHNHPRTRRLRNRNPRSHRTRRRGNLRGRNRRCGRSGGDRRRRCLLRWWRDHGRSRFRRYCRRRRCCRRGRLLHRRLRGRYRECRSRCGCRDNQAWRSCGRRRSLRSGRGGCGRCRSRRSRFYRRWNHCGARRRSRNRRRGRCRCLLLGTNGIQNIPRLGDVR